MLRSIVVPVIIVALSWHMSAFVAGEQETAQAQSSAGHDTAQHEVRVVIKLVQVQVVDKKGKYVTDLDKSDFVLTDNGQPANITEFEKHDLGLDSAPLEHQRPEAIAGSSTRGRRFFLFFDFAFSYPAGVIKSILSARDFLDTQLSPDDEIGIISYSVHSGLRLHEFLTKDRVKVRQTIDGLKQGRAMGRAADLADRYYEELKELARALGDSSEWIEHTQAIERNIYENCAADFAIQVKNFGSALRYIPGIKNIILFSSGIANMVLYGKRIEDSRSFSEKYGSSRAREKFSEMCAALAASNSVIYPINVAGRASGRFDDPHMSGENSLKQMARETGGEYFDNINYYKKINKEVLNKTAFYYVLGYYVDEKNDGIYHKIKVKVKRSGCHVYGQKGYFNPKPFKEYTENEKKLHLIDLALGEHPNFQEAVSFPALSLPFNTQGKTGFILLAKVPRGMMDQMVGQEVEVVTLVLDYKQDIVALERYVFGGGLRSDKDIFTSSLVFLDPGEYQCILVLRNMETGIGARGFCRNKIPDDPNSGLILSPPLLLRRGKCTVISETEAETGSGQNKLRFIKQYPFNTEDYRPLMEPLNKGNQELFTIVRCRASDSKNPEPKLRCHCVSDFSGEITPISTTVLKQLRIEKTDIYEMRLWMPELSPGDYTLYLFAEDRNSGIGSNVISAFRVVNQKTSIQLP